MNEHVWLIEIEKTKDSERLSEVIHIIYLYHSQIPLCGW